MMKKKPDTANEQKKQRGRPSAYKPDFAKQAAKLCSLGAIDVELAGFFEVALSTISGWKIAHPEFLEALKAGKSAVDDRVERSLYQRAVGYSHDAVKHFCQKGKVIEVPFREHLPPDTTAAIFWLKNRRKGEWRDRHEHMGAGGGPITTLDLTKLSDEQLDALEPILAMLAAADREEKPAGPLH